MFNFPVYSIPVIELIFNSHFLFISILFPLRLVIHLHHVFNLETVLFIK